jgi:hypothetical protein
MLWLLKIGALSYLGFGVLLYFGQRGMMYFPVPETSASGLDAETVPADGADLKVWVLNPGQSHALLYFGGNAENVAYNRDDFAAFLPGHTVYLVNYRGYGGSGGEPTEQALFADALVLYDAFAPRHESLDVVGRSLGSGVAVHLASQRDIGRVALVSAHDSALAVAQRLYPVYPVRWLLKDRYESVRYAAKVSAPVLLLAAENDRIIPIVHTERLAEAFTQAPVEQVVVRGADHNDISGYRDYWEALRQFLERR